MKLGNSKQIVLGLDIGIASVGWAVLTDDHIVDIGVRTFDKAETEKGESLNLQRRTARLARRRLRRRAQRLRHLTRTLVEFGLISDKSFFQPQNPVTTSLWQLRVDAISNQMVPADWARIIYHICKHRGFHWISKAEESSQAGEEGSESGKVKAGLQSTRKLMEEKDYRTIAEMVLHEFPDAQRNKGGNYEKSISRKLLAEELKFLFAQQRALGNTYATTQLEELVLGTGDCKTGFLWQQKPAIAGDQLLEMLGRCTFEKDEYRAPKASYLAERHVWLTRLNNIRLNVNGIVRSLNDEERAIAIPLPYQSGEKFTYKHLRTALKNNTDIPENFYFNGLDYPATSDKESAKTKDPENEILVKLPGWHGIRKALNNAGLENEWTTIAGKALNGDSEILDQIAWSLSVYKEDTDVIASLSTIDLPNITKVSNALLNIRFDKFHALSLKALKAIVHYMESGMRYDEACLKAEYHHSDLHKDTAKEKLLPSFYAGRDQTGSMKFNKNLDIPKNPVVLRALNQARKIVNLLVKKYGSLYRVHIELARDLSKPLDERYKLKKRYELNRSNREEAKEHLETEMQRSTPHYKANGKDLEKWLLYREQDGKCAYSLEGLDIDRLFEPGYVEVDHALPYCRSFDDGQNNKVLVLTRHNQNKGNRTPFEYLDGANDSERWQRFEAFIKSNKKYNAKKRSSLLRKNFGESESKEFRERNLNDTRYICRFFKNFIEQYLSLNEHSEASRCVVVNGQLTSYLRKRWGLTKVRSEDDRHHALDAAVVAACSHDMVKRLASYSKRKQLEKVHTGFVDIETGEVINPALLETMENHFPQPWTGFRDELQLRIYEDNLENLKNILQKLGTYPSTELDSLRTLFVSRAPKRRISGPAHKATIYGITESTKSHGGATEKVELTSLKEKDFENLYEPDQKDKLIEPHRNQRLYDALYERLKQFNFKAEKAFSPDNPFYKPDKNGNPTGSLVKSVTRVISKQTGVPVRDGIAANDTMIRVDVFSKEKKYFLIPIYVHHKARKLLPNLAVVANKPEDEWVVIDDTFDFCFSIFPNDLLTIQLKDRFYRGYYAGLDRATGAISIWAHDRSAHVGKDGLIRSIGVKTALELKKFSVDPIGIIYSCPKEKRRDLA